MSRHNPFWLLVWSGRVPEVPEQSKIRKSCLEIVKNGLVFCFPISFRFHVKTLQMNVYYRNLVLRSSKQPCFFISESFRSNIKTLRKKVKDESVVENPLQEKKISVRGQSAKISPSLRADLVI